MVDELDALAPTGDTLKLSDGTEVRLLDLKARQFFKLLKILTHGPAMQLIASQGSNSLFSGTPEAILGKLVGFIGISIPDAFDETIEFLYDMIEPANLTGRTDKASAAIDKSMKQDLAKLMVNPDLEDLLDLIEAIVKRESDDLVALGKKVAKLMKVAEKTGQLDTPPVSPAPSTSEVSPESSTL